MEEVVVQNFFVASRSSRFNLGQNGNSQLNSENYQIISLKLGNFIIACQSGDERYTRRRALKGVSGNALAS